MEFLSATCIASYQNCLSEQETGNYSILFDMLLTSSYTYVATSIPYSTKLWRISAHSIFGRENIGGLVIFSALEIDSSVCIIRVFQ